MRVLRSTARELKTVTSPERMLDIVERYVPLQSLWLKCPGESVPVRATHGTVPLQFIINGERLPQQGRVTLFAVNFRYIELNLELKATPEKENIPAQIVSVSIATDKRQRIRFDAQELIHLHSITMSGVHEEPASITGSMPFKILLPQIERELDAFDHRRVISINDPVMPPEMEFVRKTGVMLRIRDLANTADYFASNGDYFIDQPELREQLEQRFKELSHRYRSLLVRPVEYLSITGRQLPIAILAVARATTDINNDDVLFLDDYALELFRRLRAGLLTEEKVLLPVTNISTHGVQFWFRDLDLATRLLHPEAVLCELGWGRERIKISGTIPYIIGDEARGCLAGIDFHGSRYGAGLEKKMLTIIQKTGLKPDRDLSPRGNQEDGAL